MMSDRQQFICLGIDHIHFFVHDLAAWQTWYQQVWGFRIRGHRLTPATESIWLSHQHVQVILSQSRHGNGEVADYLAHHPQGVVDVALRVSSAEAAWQWHDRHNCSITPLVSTLGLQTYQLSIPVCGAADRNFHHSLIERSDPAALLLGFEPLAPDPQSTHPAWFSHIDHVVLNVPTGALQPTVAWYEQALGWQPHYRYHVSTDRSGLGSVVVGADPQPDPAIQLAINEPIGAQSQIQEFIEANHGSGIQHVALHSPSILSTVEGLRSRGVDFLAVPDAYYRSVSPEVPRAAELAAQQLLIDVPSGHPGEALILQTFTQPLFSEPTFFYEVIERRGSATGFGEHNFQTLYEAMEQQQLRRTNEGSANTKSPMID